MSNFLLTSSRLNLTPERKVKLELEDDGIKIISLVTSVEVKAFNKEIVLSHSRMIPTSVKVEVWASDKGQCVICGSKENLHYDHDLPFSKAAQV